VPFKENPPGLPLPDIGASLGLFVNVFLFNTAIDIYIYYYY
jgi:hypothetical protein